MLPGVPCVPCGLQLMSTGQLQCCAHFHSPSHMWGHTGGVRSEEEARALNARIAKLTTTLEGVNAEHSMLLEQVGGGGRREVAHRQRPVPGRMPVV